MILLIKIGGGANINLNGIIQDLSTINEKFVIIHGGNSLRDDLAKIMNKPKKIVTSISGYSSVLSDNDAIDMLLMAYAGIKNKRIVELCQIYGINAIGLTGADGKLIQGKRNKGIRVNENNKVKIKHDNSGKPEKINTDLINILLTNGYVPIITVPIIDEENRLINSENDDILTVLQNSLSADTVISLIEAPGLLEDSSNEETVIKKLSKQDLIAREDSSSGRIKRKLYAMKKLIEQSPKRIIIADGRTEHPIRDALANIGTLIM
ncbi:MAG: [LysW]-aminoadipate kinase [Candidatus Thorarchaeota archaeon]